jgi:hypothetical protein
METASSLRASFANSRRGLSGEGVIASSGTLMAMSVESIAVSFQ